MASPLRLAANKDRPVDPQEDNIIASQYNVADCLFVFHGHDRGLLWLRLVGKGLRFEDFILLL
nr:hypothetical protein [Candidatus Sigynarchaeum springense]